MKTSSRVSQGEPHGPGGRSRKRHLSSLRRGSTRPQRIGIAAILVLASVLTMLPWLSPPKAHAARNGAGVHLGQLYIGNFITERDGAAAYCVELHKTPPRHIEGSPERLDTLPAFQAPGEPAQPAANGDTLRRLNYLVSTHGKTQNSEQAAVVALAVWKIRAGKQEPRALASISKEIRQHGRGDLLTRADRLVSQVNAIDFDKAYPRPSKPVLRMSHAYSGTVTVSQHTRTLTLTNAVFSDTGSASRDFGNGLTADREFAITAKPPLSDQGWVRNEKIRAHGTYRYPTVSSTVTVHRTPGAQTLMPVPEQRLEWKAGEFSTEITVDTTWKPVLTTETPVKKVPKGQHFSDAVTLTVAPDSQPWRHAYAPDGTQRFAPITAKGTLYGPFLSDPAKNPAPEPPAGAPVAAKATVTTNTSQGDQTIEVTTKEVSRETGYYTWQWIIDASDQDPSVTLAGKPGEPALPKQYRYADGFGVKSEGQYTEMELSLATALSQQEVALHDTLTDTVTVTLGNRGGWLQGDDGSRIPVILTGTLYRTDTKPVRQATVPADAEAVHTFEPIVVNSPDEKVTSSAYRVPLTARGYYTAVWCVREDAQPEHLRGLVKEHCDEFGVPSETAKILRPEVTTTAQAETVVFDTAQDTANVTGTLPKAETRIRFSAYLVPQAGTPKYTENWQPVRDEHGAIQYWTEAEIVSGQPCEVQPVAHTEAVTVKNTGAVRSPAITTRSPGTLFWVETLEARTATDQPWVQLHRGVCGLPNETTRIELPKVTTTAIEQAVPGDTITDTATVTGPIPAGEDGAWELTFAAYHANIEQWERGSESDREKLCTPETKIWESSKAHPVTAPGQYRSESLRVSERHLGKILWVETLTYRDRDGGERFSRSGRCGETKEVTTVTAPPPLSETGVSQGELWLFGGLAAGASLTLLFTAGIVRTVRRRQVKNHSELSS